MKKTILSLAIVSSFALCATAAYAVKDPAGWQREGQKMIEMKHDKSFDDLSNTITNEEYKTYFDKQFNHLKKDPKGRISHEQVLFIDFVLADTNKDGALDRGEAEHIPLIKDHFDAIDGSIDIKKDDRITGDELIEFMATWRKNHEGKMLH